MVMFHKLMDLLLNINGFSSPHSQTASGATDEPFNPSDNIHFVRDLVKNLRQITLAVE
jgi:hypothetical protein